MDISKKYKGETLWVGRGSNPKGGGRGAPATPLNPLLTVTMLNQPYYHVDFFRYQRLFELRTLSKIGLIAKFKSFTCRSEINFVSPAIYPFSFEAILQNFCQLLRTLLNISRELFGKKTKLLSHFNVVTLNGWWQLILIENPILQKLFHFWLHD